MIKIHRGDCFEYLNKIPNGSLDCVITDPPYEQCNHGGGTTPMSNRGLNKGSIDFMSLGFDYEQLFTVILEKLKTPNILVFCSNSQISKFMSFFECRGLSTTLLVWKKTNPVPFGNGKYISDAEFIVYVRGKRACFNSNCPTSYKQKVKLIPTITKNKLHPAEKPIELLNQLVEVHTKIGDTIFDPYMGSGTTGAAAITLKRSFIGCEINRDYYDVAKRRIQECMQR